MIIRESDLTYLNAIMGMIGKGEMINRKLTDVLGGLIEPAMMFCPECDEEIDQFSDRDHLIMLDSSDHPFIAIACEGYHPIAID